MDNECVTAPLCYFSFFHEKHRNKGCIQACASIATYMYMYVHQTFNSHCVEHMVLRLRNLFIQCLY